MDLRPPLRARAVDFATPSRTIAAGAEERFVWRPEVFVRPDWLRLWVWPSAAARDAVAVSLVYNAVRLVELPDFRVRSSILEPTPSPQALAAGIAAGSACVSLNLEHVMPTDGIKTRVLGPPESLECIVRNDSFGMELSVAVGFDGWGFEP